jgi:hypothetical protein
MSETHSNRKETDKTPRQRLVEGWADNIAQWANSMPATPWFLTITFKANLMSEKHLFTTTEIEGFHQGVHRFYQLLNQRTLGNRWQKRPFEELPKVWSFMELSGKTKTEQKKVLSRRATSRSQPHSHNIFLLGDTASQLVQSWGTEFGSYASFITHNLVKDFIVSVDCKPMSKKTKTKGKWFRSDFYKTVDYSIAEQFKRQYKEGKGADLYRTLPQST